MIPNIFYDYLEQYILEMLLYFSTNANVTPINHSENFPFISSSPISFVQLFFYN